MINKTGVVYQNGRDHTRYSIDAHRLLILRVTSHQMIGYYRVSPGDTLGVGHVRLNETVDMRTCINVFGVLVLGS
jgi:hypothetical protein